MKSQVSLSNSCGCRRRSLSQRARTWSIAAIAIFAGGSAVAGCSAAAEGSEPQTCAEIVEKAAYQQEVEDEVKWFDIAIQRCGSYAELKAEMDRYDLPGYPVERFLEKRCTDEAETLASTNVCMVAAPPTTLPEVVENPEYTGRTLDGRNITVTPDEVEFDGPLPTVIATTVELAQQGCISVLGVRDDFAHFINDTREGDIASMYAQHAQSVAAFIGCQIPPIVIGPSGPNVTAVPPTTAAP